MLSFFFSMKVAGVYAVGSSLVGYDLSHYIILKWVIVSSCALCSSINLLSAKEYFVKEVLDYLWMLTPSPAARTLVEQPV